MAILQTIQKWRDDRKAEQAAELRDTISTEIQRAFSVQQPVTPLQDPRTKNIPAIGANHALAQLRPEGPRQDGTPYHLDEPWHFWVVQNPKRLPGKLIDVRTIKRMAETYDVLRSCVEYLKSEVVSTPMEVVARDPQSAEHYEKQIQQATEWFADDGPLGLDDHPRSHFEMKMVEDTLTVGAYAAWYKGNRGGGVNGVYMIDASTIRPRVDSMGWPDTTVPFEQFIQGVQAAGFRPGELRYQGLFPRTDTPYYTSIIEWLIYLVTAAIKADSWNSDWLTGGTTRKGDVFTLPSDWTLEQIQGFADYWDVIMSGDAGERAKSRFLPDGSMKIADHTRHEMDFQLYEEWLMRRVCSVMGVSPSAIGHESKQYKVSQEGSQFQTRRLGAGRLLEMRRLFYNDLLRRMGFDMLEVKNVTDDSDEQQKRADTQEKTVGVPTNTVNEGRKAQGLEPVAGGDVVLVPRTHVPIHMAEQLAAAPVPGEGEGDDVT